MADNRKSTSEQAETKLDIVAIELRRAREAKSLSHSDLNRLTGISRPVLFGYEAGRTRPGTKELRLLSEALGVSPNRLLFGTEEPFKTKKGLRALAKLRNTPVSMVVLMFMVPMAMAVLDDEQIESLLTILASLIESRDQKTYQVFSAMAEIFSEEIGNGTQEEITAFSNRAKDPRYMEDLQKRLNSLIS